MINEIAKSLPGNSVELESLLKISTASITLHLNGRCAKCSSEQLVSMQGTSMNPTSPILTMSLPQSLFAPFLSHQEASSSDHVYMCCMWQNLAVMFEFTHGRIQAAMITAEMSLQDQTAFAPQTLPQDWPICDAAVSISYDHFPQEVLVSTRGTPSN